MGDNPKTGSPDVVWDHGEVPREERWSKLGLRGATLWFTGLSGSGKSTVAARVEKLLLDHKRLCYRLDGDNLRHGLNGDLGFSPADRQENIRRIGEVCLLFADSGALSLATFISPYRRDRRWCRERHAESELDFIEVFVDTPLEVCEQRDPKGLYARARAGEVPEMTGIGAPYEPPEAPELRLDTTSHDVDACARLCLDLLSKRGLV